MKLTNLFNSKFTILILFSFLFLQSCKVYHSNPSSTTEAIESDSRAKVTLTNGKTYKFNRIDRKDGELFGIAKKKSKTAKKLASQIITKNNKVVKIKLDENSIQKIRVQNKSMSTLATIGTVIGLTAFTAAGTTASLFVVAY